MGRLIMTGVEVAGHSLRAVEHGHPVESCDVICTCGWSKTLTAYGKPWVVIEVQRSFDRHLTDLGIPVTSPSAAADEMSHG